MNTTVIKVGNTYKSRFNQTTVVVNAVFGDKVYYKDSYGCYHNNSVQVFIKQHGCVPVNA